MYLSLRLRSEQSLQDVCDAFRERTPLDRLIFPSDLDEDMAGVRHRAATSLDYHSTASAPSLRGRVPVEEMERPMTPDGDAGHVKVVVRCRKFVTRGESGVCAAKVPWEMANVHTQRSRSSRHV